MIGVNEIKMQLEIAEKEIASLQSGRKASAARARKCLQIIKGLSHTLRKQIVEYSRSLPIKKREAIEPPTEPTEPTEPTVPIAPKPKAPKAPRKRNKTLSNLTNCRRRYNKPN